MQVGWNITINGEIHRSERKRILLNENAIRKLSIANKKAEVSASLTVTKPAAIGLKRFCGCFLSDSISIESFNKYIELDIKHKQINAKNEANHISSWLNSKVKSGAAKTIKFFEWIWNIC